MAYVFEAAGRRHDVVASKSADGVVLEIDGEVHSIDLRSFGDGEHTVRLNSVARRAWIAARGDTVFVQIDGEVWTVRRVDASSAAAGEGDAANIAKAPMPGTVVSVAVSPDEPVTKGQTLMVIESMKLQSAVAAWRDGAVAEVHLNEGDTFERDAPLVSLAPAEQ